MRALFLAPSGGLEFGCLRRKRLNKFYLTAPVSRLAASLILSGNPEWTRGKIRYAHKNRTIPFLLDPGPLGLGSHELCFAWVRLVHSKSPAQNPNAELFIRSAYIIRSYGRNSAFHPDLIAYRIQATLAKAISLLLIPGYIYFLHLDAYQWIPPGCFQRDAFAVLGCPSARLGYG
jgi:hypothetical protein